MAASSDTVADEFSQDAPAGPSEESLARVVRLAERLVSLEAEIAEQEARLKLLGREHQLIVEGELPEAMDSCGDGGIRSLTLGDGSKLSVSTKYRCGQLDDLPDDPKRPERRSLGERLSGLTWLVEHGHGDLARRTITITLGSGSEEAERRIRDHFESLRANSARYSAANVVPWNTLSAFARDMDSRHVGEAPLPLDELGVQKVRVASVRHSKARDEL